MGKKKKAKRAKARGSQRQQPPAEAEQREASPEARAKDTRTLRWIALLVAVQLLIPLTYYLRDDPYDERFAWRMFSGIRLHQCRTRAFDLRGESALELDLNSVIHRAWINNLARNRRDVIESYLRARCAQEEAPEGARIINDCVTATGETLSPQRYAIDCATGEITLPQAGPR